MSEREDWHFDQGDEIAPGRYAIRALGGGYRYEAYLAWDDALYALVAVKVVRPNLVADPHVLDGLAGEAHALSSLAHPSLVRAFDVDLECERPHLVLEYLDGPRLSSMIRAGGIAVEQILPLILQLCSVVHYVHGAGWLHLDVKPRNIIMAGPPRLIDLSIARPLSQVAAIDGPVGTRLYMAPEQCDPSRYGQIGPPADIWGIGATLHEALSGRNPFADAADRAPDDRHPQLSSPPDPLPRSVPGALADLVGECLRDSPRDRPTASALADALAPLTDRLPPPRLGLFRPGGRRRFARMN